MIGANQLGRSRGAGGEEEAQAGWAGRAGPRAYERVEQPAMRSRDASEIADALGAIVCQTRSASKPSWITTPAPAVERRQREDLQAERMEEWRDDEHAVVAPDAEEGARVAAVEERLAVGQECALRQARRARRVHQDHRILGIRRVEWAGSGGTAARAAS